MKWRESLVKGEQLQLTSTRSGTQSRGIHCSECSVGTEFLSTCLVTSPASLAEPIQSPEG